MNVSGDLASQPARIAGLKTGMANFQQALSAGWKTGVTTPARGFTLIELLVMIAIIGILASLLLPALGRSKASALATECRGSLRSIGLATRMYLEEFHH